MDKNTLLYIVFAVVIVIALIVDLGLLSKKDQKVTLKAALFQTLFWVSLAMSFLVFLYIEKGPKPALEFLSAYVMEWSLSVDNIFVFILIFTSFSISEKSYGRVLLVGILLAIVFRIIFIAVGVALVAKFSWILYLFGAFLIFTGWKMFFSSEEEEEFDPKKSKIYMVVSKMVPIVPNEGGGRFFIKRNGKRFYTTLFIVVIMLGFIDIVFAIDSIPAVMGIVDTKTVAYQDTARLVIYTSNIFAVLGLRSLFFLLRGAVNKFQYLPKGIAIVLVFIGVEMLAEHWISEWFDTTTKSFISLAFICICLGSAMLYSVFVDKKEKKKVDDIGDTPQLFQ